MENMLTRLRKIFLDSGENQTEISKKTNVTSAYIWKILNKDDVRPSDLFINSVCQEFNVNEHWLRTGEGNPKKQRTRNQEVLEFANDVMEDVDESFKKRFILALSKLNESDWKTIEKIVDELTKED